MARNGATVAAYDRLRRQRCALQAGFQGDSLRLSILKQLIDNEILMQRAEKLGVLATDAAVDAIKQWRYETGPKETTETVDFAFENSTR